MSRPMTSNSHKAEPKFLGLALTSGPRRFVDGAQVGIDRGLKSNRADFIPVSDLDLLRFIEDASEYLRQKAERAEKEQVDA